MDIKNVFLHGDLCEEVYMEVEQPPDFVNREEHSQLCHGKVYQFRKSLYVLQQSSQAWLGKFS